MKMTLDQLRVDSYATQVNENELTEVKGGTSMTCYQWSISLAVSIASWWDSASEGDTKITVGTTKVVTDKLIKADSITTKGVYGIETKN